MRTSCYCKTQAHRWRAGRNPWPRPGLIGLTFVGSSSEVMVSKDSAPGKSRQGRLETVNGQRHTKPARHKSGGPAAQPYNVRRNQHRFTAQGSTSQKRLWGPLSVPGRPSMVLAHGSLGYGNLARFHRCL